MVLDNTPIDPHCGYDLYIDASGEDNWSEGNDKFYLSGIIVTNPREQWVRWMHKHKTQYEGSIHFSHGTFGDGKKLPNKKAVCRDLITDSPWAFSFISIFHKQSLIDGLASGLGIPEKYDISRSIWHISINQFGLVFVPHVNRAMGERQDKNTIREIIINNPKSGDRGRIESQIQQMLSRTPQFVSAGHPGIDAVDGILWGLRRVLELNKVDAVPWSNDAEIGKQIFIFGVSSDNPTHLRSLNQIEQWRDSCLASKRMADAQQVNAPDRASHPP